MGSSFDGCGGLAITSRSCNGMFCLWPEIWVKVSTSSHTWSSGISSKASHTQRDKQATTLQMKQKRRHRGDTSGGDATTKNRSLCSETCFSWYPGRKAIHVFPQFPEPCCHPLSSSYFALEKNICLTGRVVKCWSKLPREALQSLTLEMSKSHLGIALEGSSEGPCLSSGWSWLRV